MAPLNLPDCKNARVLVVGDVMLDRYWFGNVDRISPEAPVPIVHVQRTEERPGGAANVARNVAALGGQATLLSVVGDDEAGRSLAALLTEENVKNIESSIFVKKMSIWCFVVNVMDSPSPVCP